MTILIIILSLIAILLLLSWFMSSYIINPPRMKPEKCYAQEVAKGKIDRQKYEHDYNREDFEIDSEYGYKLSCSFIPKKEEITFSDGKTRAIVIVHGFSFNRYGSIKYIDIFRDLGFCCLIYDHRNHGTSGKAPTTMGYLEAHDLKTVCDYMRKRLGNNLILGTHGESMGAATVMINASLDDKLDFVIEDCGFSSTPAELAYKMKEGFHLPVYPILPIASFFLKLRTGINFNDIKPINNITMCDKIPMLFLHGGDDHYVPTYMVKELYTAKKGIKSMKIFPDAHHAESFWRNKEVYTDTVREFLTQNKIIPQ